MKQTKKPEKENKQEQGGEEVKRRTKGKRRKRRKSCLLGNTVFTYSLSNKRENNLQS